MELKTETRITTISEISIPPNTYGIKDWNKIPFVVCLCAVWDALCPLWSYGVNNCSTTRPWDSATMCHCVRVYSLSILLGDATAEVQRHCRSPTVTLLHRSPAQGTLGEDLLIKWPGNISRCWGMTYRAISHFSEPSAPSVAWDWKKVYQYDHETIMMFKIEKKEANMPNHYGN